MATDNVVLSTNIGTGATLRTLSDGASEWEAAVVCYATTVTPGGNVLQVVTAAAGLPVAQQGAWTVTANAGTNLNTSLLALEAGGNLAALNTKTPALGQALAAASSPVVLTAIQVAALTPLSSVGITGSVAVTGTFWQATQPVSIASPVAVTESGTWNIATVTTVTTLTGITNALPAGTNLLGTISASGETSTLYSGTTALTPLFAVFNLSASGATQIVALTGGKRIRVLRYSVDFNSTVNFNLQSHTTTALATGIKYGIANKTAGGAYCEVGIMQTAVGEALDGNLSGTGTVSGELTYVLV